MSAQNTINLEEEYKHFLQKNEIPDWIKGIKDKAFEHLQNTPFVSKSLEAWRKIQLTNFNLKELLSEYKNDTKHNFEFQTQDIPSIQASLESILEKNKEEFFVLLNLCFFNCLNFVYINNSTEKQYAKISLDQKQETVFMPLTIFQIDKFVTCTIEEEIIANNTNSNISFINPVTFIQTADSSHVRYYTAEKFNSSIFHIRKIYSKQSKNSDLQLGYFNLGGYKGKTFIETDMSGEGGNFELFGSALPIKREFQDVDCQVNHLASFTSSSLRMKVALKNKSHHVFVGNLYIPQTSRQVNATQTNNNLILDKTARAESMPKLEVFAEDVSCSHGATMGEVEAEEMFYLCSRGLTEKEARYLIVTGFLNEIIDKISSEELLEEIKTTLNSKLDS